MEKDQAGSNPGQIHVVQAGPNPEPVHEDFIAIVYPQVHESLKLTTKEHVHIENPPSSFGCLSSMKNLDDAFIFGDQFLNDKPSKEEPGKANVETKVDSMVTVPIHQASYSVPPLSTPIIDLTPPKPICANFEKKNKLQDKTTQALSSRVYTLENHDLYSKIDKYINDVIKEAVHNDLQAPIHERFRDLYEYEMKEILRDRMEEFIEATTKSRKRRRDDQDPPHLLQKTLTKARRKRMIWMLRLQNSLQFRSWKISDTRKAPSNSSKQKFASPSEQPVDDVPIPDDVHLSDLEDTGVAHLPKIKTRLADALAKTYTDPEENKLLRKTRDMGSFINWYCKQIGKSKLVKADLEGPAYKLVKPFHKNNISLQFQMEECHLLLTDQINLMNPGGNQVVHDIIKALPLGGPPGDKERRNALSISKLKAAYYPDFGLKELVSSLWIESERDYDISATYGISHWWFKHKEFYITRHSAHSNRSAVRSHMKILSVVSLKTFSRYGYTYLKEIVLRRADYKEYKITEADFKNLHPNDFEDMYLLHLQGKLNHLSGADKVHLFNAVNLWIRNIVIRQRVEDLQLEDYTIIHKPRAVIYRDRNNQKKMMRETEVYKFSDGTLSRILEKLDFMVKDYELFNSLSEEYDVLDSNSHVVSVSSSINTRCDSFASHDDNASSSNSLKTPKLMIHHEFIDTPGGSVYSVPKVSASVLPVLGTVNDNLEECIHMYRKYTSEAGSFSLVHGTQTEFKNFTCGVNCFIGDSDAQMLITKMEERQEFTKDFSCDYFVKDAELCGLFWANEVAKCNYKEFGDIVSFDATYKTNKYKMVFVPFTAIDNHRRSVTVGSGLLKKETTKAYGWLLRAFKKAFIRVPNIVVTNQDGVMRFTVAVEFLESKHRLCMWHIMQKIPSKEFKDRWNKLMEEFNLVNHKWLSKMYRLRSSWIPAFFVDSPLCGLMSTTSRSESENSFFLYFTSSGSTLVKFMLCYEFAMERQRHTQEKLDHQSFGSFPTLLTPLPIEEHAAKVYTRSLFIRVQKEIVARSWLCSITGMSSDEGCTACIINEEKIKPVGLSEVIDKESTSENVEEEINLHQKVTGHYKINIYIEALDQGFDPTLFEEQKNRYGEKNEAIEKLAMEASIILDSCVHMLRNNEPKLSVFINKMIAIKSELEAKLPIVPTRIVSDFVQEFMGVKKPDKVKVKNPTGVRPQGCEKQKRIKRKNNVDVLYLAIVVPGGSDYVDGGLRDGASGSVSV
ncbi:retrovirus-related pol polyprotein from transposon TNT 1-94 [Tanacetum coccineum]